MLTEIQKNVTDIAMQPLLLPEARDPLSKALANLEEVASGHPHLSLDEILDALGPEGPTLAAALLTLPFLQPIPMLGVSTPVGFTIAISGLGLFLQRKIAIPKRLARAKLPTASVLKITAYLVRFEHKLKRHLNSDPAVDTIMTRRFLGLTIAAHGILLALPLPIPFSNTMPAWMCFFAAMTVLFASRRLLWISILMLLANIAFWTSLMFATIKGSGSLVEWLGSIL